MKKLIIVDDDPAIMDAIQLVFDKQYSVVGYDNAESILNMEFEMPDLFILDKQLSGISGVDVCKFLKNNVLTQHIPVVMISASPAIQVWSKDCRPDAVIEKPFPIKLMRETVTKLIGGAVRSSSL
jgi:DNA-binding response OmpR family regulator